MIYSRCHNISCNSSWRLNFADRDSLCQIQRSVLICVLNQAWRKEEKTTEGRGLPFQLWNWKQSDHTEEGKGQKRKRIISTPPGWPERKKGRGESANWCSALHIKFSSFCLHWNFMGFYFSFWELLGVLPFSFPNLKGLPGWDRSGVIRLLNACKKCGQGEEETQVRLSYLRKLRAVG